MSHAASEHRDSGHDRRQRPRLGGHRPRAQPPDVEQPPRLLAGHRGLAGGRAGHADRCPVRGAGQPLGAGPADVRDLDVRRRDVLHVFHPAPGGHRRRSVPGRHQRGLRPAAELQESVRHDSGRVGDRVPGVFRTGAWVEG